MALAQLVVHAAVQAFADALGVSGTAHGLALGLWISAPERPAIAGAVGLGAGLAVLVAARARLFPALMEGARALGRPRSFQDSPKAREALAIVWMVAVSAVGTWVLLRAGVGGVGGASDVAGATGGVGGAGGARAVAVGLGATGIALVGGAYLSWARRDAAAGRGLGKAAAGGATGAPRLGFETPSLLGAALAGAAHALGACPGVPRVGAATAMLLALGMKPIRAVELALVATVPFWFADFARALPEVGALGKGTTLVNVLFAFLGALGAFAALRALAARRALGALSFWTIPLACAIFAYARASSALL